MYYDALNQSGRSKKDQRRWEHITNHGVAKKREIGVYPRTLLCRTFKRHIYIYVLHLLW